MSSCPFCSHSNPSGARFCNDCGSPLTLQPCPHCEAVNDAAAAECHRCGAPLDVAAVKSGDAAVLLHPHPAREATTGAKAREASEAVARQHAHIASAAGAGPDARQTSADQSLSDGAKRPEDGASTSGPAATEAHIPESIFDRMERGIDARLAGEWAKPHVGTGDAEPFAAGPHVANSVADAISSRPRPSASVAEAIAARSRASSSVADAIPARPGASASVADATAARPRARASVADATAARPRGRASVADALPRGEPRGRAPDSRADRRRARASSGLLGAAIALAVLALGVAGYFTFVDGVPGSRSDSAVAFGERQGKASASEDSARAGGSPGVATKSSGAEAGANPPPASVDSVAAPTANPAAAALVSVQPGAPGVRAPNASGAPAPTAAKSGSRSAASTTAADSAPPASRTRRPSDAAAIATQRLIERDLKPFLPPKTTGTEGNTYPSIN